MAQQSYILPDCDWPLLSALFRAAIRAMLRWARKQGLEVGIFYALHTPADCRGMQGISAIKLSGSDICRRSTDDAGRCTSQRRPEAPGEASNTGAGT